MVKIHCCICDRRTDTNKQRIRIGSTSCWPFFQKHVEKIGRDVEQFSRDDYICIKCNSTISHYRMDDRGSNKKVKIAKPFVFEMSITKDVLRNHTKKTALSGK